MPRTKAAWQKILRKLKTTDPAAQAKPVPCSNDEDCSLNGLCTNKVCVCDAGWTTLPHGIDNAMAPGCGYLDFLPATATSCGPACAFHGGINDNKSTSSWGGSGT